MHCVSGIYTPSLRIDLLKKIASNKKLTEYNDVPILRSLLARPLLYVFRDRTSLFENSLPGNGRNELREHPIQVTVNPRIEAGVSVYILGGTLPVTELHVRCVVIRTPLHVAIS